MDEGAGLDVAVGVDVQVAPSARDAAARVLAVVPEVHGEDGLCGAERAHLLVQEAALLRRDHQVRHRVAAHGHVGEEPAELRAPGDHLVKVRLAADDLHVLTGVAAGDAKGQLPLAQQSHGALHAAERARAAAGIRRFLKALDGDGGEEVLDAQHLVGKGLVDEGAVGEGGKLAVRVRLAEAQDVRLAHERLAAGEEVEVDAQLLALAEDVLQLRIAEVEPIAVLRRPTARAVQVAGGGGVDEHRPGDVAVVLAAQLVVPLALQERAVPGEVLKERAPMPSQRRRTKRFQLLSGSARPSLMPRITPSMSLPAGP